MRGSKSVALLCALVFNVSVFSVKLTRTLPGGLTMVQAQIVVQVSIEKMHEIKVPMNITVIDAGDSSKTLARMDDTLIGSVDTAQKRAKTARYSNMSTRDLGKTSQPGGEPYGIEVTSNDLAIFADGILPVNRTGVIVGSVSVSGDSVNKDEDVAKAGAAALPSRQAG